MFSAAQGRVPKCIWDIHGARELVIYAGQAHAAAWSSMSVDLSLRMRHSPAKLLHPNMHAISNGTKLFSDAPATVSLSMEHRVNVVHEEEKSLGG